MGVKLTPHPRPSQWFQIPIPGGVKIIKLFFYCGWIFSNWVVNCPIRKSWQRKLVPKCKMFLLVTFNRFILLNCTKAFNLSYNQQREHLKYTFISWKFLQKEQYPFAYPVTGPCVYWFLDNTYCENFCLRNCGVCGISMCTVIV